MDIAQLYPFRELYIGIKLQLLLDGCISCLPEHGLSISGVEMFRQVEDYSATQVIQYRHKVFE